LETVQVVWEEAWLVNVVPRVLAEY
jgi:hypothetical protein